MFLEYIIYMVGYRINMLLFVWGYVNVCLFLGSLFVFLFFFEKKIIWIIWEILFMLLYSVSYLICKKRGYKSGLWGVEFV